VAARTAAQKGMKIFTLGVGTSAGARIAERRDGAAPRYARNEFGGEVITRLNERMLQQVAASGSGFYEGLGMGDAGLVSIWRRGLAPMSKGTQSRQSKDLQEYFQWPLAMALALLLWEMLVSDRRQRPAVNRP
jgi:Ca-activated chloride channel homolog